MPKSKYKQNHLYVHKCEFLILEHWDRLTRRELAKAFSVSKSTVDRFVTSKRYKMFKFSVVGNEALQLILDKWSKWDVEDILALNDLEEDEVMGMLKTKYPKLFAQMMKVVQKE